MNAWESKILIGDCRITDDRFHHSTLDPSGSDNVEAGHTAVGPAGGREGSDENGSASERQAASPEQEAPQLFFHVSDIEGMLRAEAQELRNERPAPGELTRRKEAFKRRIAEREREDVLRGRLRQHGHQRFDGLLEQTLEPPASDNGQVRGITWERLEPVSLGVTDTASGQPRAITTAMIGSGKTTSAIEQMMLWLEGSIDVPTRLGDAQLALNSETGLMLVLAETLRRLQGLVSRVLDRAILVFELDHDSYVVAIRELPCSSSNWSTTAEMGRRVLDEMGSQDAHRRRTHARSGPIEHDFILLSLFPGPAQTCARPAQPAVYKVGKLTGRELPLLFDQPRSREPRYVSQFLHVLQERKLVQLLGSSAEKHADRGLNSARWAHALPLWPAQIADAAQRISQLLTSQSAVPGNSLIYDRAEHVVVRVGSRRHWSGDLWAHGGSEQPDPVSNPPGSLDDNAFVLWSGNTSRAPAAVTVRPDPGEVRSGHKLDGSAPDAGEALPPISVEIQGDALCTRRSNS